MKDFACSMRDREFSMGAGRVAFSLFWVLNMRVNGVVRACFYILKKEYFQSKHINESCPHHRENVD